MIQQEDRGGVAHEESCRYREDVIQMDVVEDTKAVYSCRRRHRRQGVRGRGERRGAKSKPRAAKRVIKDARIIR